MKPFIVLLSSFLLSFTAFSQSCLPEGITFTTQAQINSFYNEYPGCTEIQGDVTISGNNIVSLNGLTVLTALGSSLIIEDNPQLTNLVGLQNIIRIDSNLTIKNNSALPNLSGLGSLVHIGNNLYIGHNYDMTSLTGLENLNSIGYDLRIVSNLDLLSLSGLNNLDSIENDFSLSINVDLTNFIQLEDLVYIGGNFLLYSNHSLHDFTGLENLTSLLGNLELNDSQFLNFSGLEGLDSIGGNINIFSCDKLNSFSGLENLTKIGGYLNVYGAYNLDNLEGLNNLTSIGNGLTIGNNHVLTSLGAFASLSAVNGDISIYLNPILPSLTGLDNIDPESINNLKIYKNDSLTFCGVESICTYLENPGGIIDIYKNGVGCNTPYEIADQCGIILNCLPYGYYRFFNQMEIDSFQTHYPECDELGGDVDINGYGSDIYNLIGLSSTNSIGGALYITWCDSLKDLNGLQNISIIGGGLHVSLNSSLISFEQLANLTSVNGYLLITNNTKLQKLTGLDNIAPQSISNLVIYNNDLLYYCEVQSICEYLANPVGNVNIIYNAYGCNNETEILPKCEVGYENVVNQSAYISLYPNPASNVLFIESLEEIECISVYDVRGDKVIRWEGDKGKVVLQVDGLAPGLYLVRVETKNGVFGRKVVIR